MHHALICRPNEELPDGIQVMFKSPETGMWDEPATVKLMGRGYMCLLTDKGICWIPAKWVKPYLKSHLPANALSRSRTSVTTLTPDPTEPDFPAPDG